jgi:hypothetical protein
VRAFAWLAAGSVLLFAISSHLAFINLRLVGLILLFVWKGARRFAAFPPDVPPDAASDADPGAPPPSGTPSDGDGPPPSEPSSSRPPERAPALP